MSAPAITVLYFAAASTATGRTSETIQNLGPLLISRYPTPKLEDTQKISRWSVDAEMVDDPEMMLLKK